MDALTANMPLVLFLIVGTIAVASSILVVAMRNPVHSALFLLVTFLCVAMLFIMRGAEFVGAVQVLVYAGGIMVLFLFVVMLINVRTLADEKMTSPFLLGGLAVGAAIFILFATIVRTGAYHDEVNRPELLKSTSIHSTESVKAADGTLTTRRVVRHERVGNSEAVGTALYQDYLVPFEVASLFLLVAMIGAIVIGKRELSHLEEDAIPKFILDRVEAERDVKEIVNA
jgi:NADH-quinone oxidoreductase subunit J